MDELDEMDTHAVWLALERLSGQIEKHILAISTPTVPKYGIHKLYLTSTQEHFCFQCPHCGRRTELVWPDCVEIIGESVNDPRCQESFLKCKECKHKLDHEAKPEFLAGGKWQVTEPNVSAEESRGFYINQLYSSTVTPGELVIAYHRGLGDEAANTEFHCSKLGVPFIGEGAQVTDEMIEACIKDTRSTTPAADRRRSPDNDGRGPGQDRVHLGRGLVVRRHPGTDINAAAIGKLLWFGKFSGEEWGYLDELMREWQVLACVVDADPFTNDARRFAKKFPATCG